MEVTKSTFFELLPKIKQSIDAASFLTIDCELTGLNTVSDINAYDTPKQYFEKVRNTSKDFLVIQFGLCIFRFDKESNTFKHATYNFYIFPRPINRIVPDHRFLCQASSIDFLITQGFDFNKLFKEGIPYLNKDNEIKYKEVLEEGRAARAKLYLSPQQLSTMNVPEEDKPFIDNVFVEIEEFIKSGEKERVLPKCNAFLRRLIYQTARGRLDNRASLETRQLDNKDRVLVVTRPKTIDDRNKDEKAKMRDEAESLREAIGFSTLMNYISESRKLIVGHNMMLDVCHSIDKFLTFLPSDYRSFKECVHCLFPNIIDTKYMSSTGPFKDIIPSTVLSQVLATVSAEPFIVPPLEPESDSLSYSLDGSKEHEAGYDAYITGICFISMWKYLGDQKKVQNMFEHFNLLMPYVNRLFLMRIQDAPFIQLDGPDPNPSRDHVFYLTFPKDWKLNDIVQLFSPFGNVFVAWINERAAYIALHKREQAAVALSTLSQSDTYSIKTYAQYQASLAEKMLASVKLPARKRNSDGIPPTKKRKSNNNSESSVLNRKVSMDAGGTVIENDGSGSDNNDGPVPCLIKPRKRTISKTFQEDSSWE